MTPNTILSEVAAIMTLMKRALVCSGLLLVLSVGFIWAQVGTGWYRVATLATDVEAGETLLGVEWSGTALVDQPILIEARDGSYVEIRAIRHIYDHHIILDARLQNDFVAGSRIYR